MKSVECSTGFETSFSHRAILLPQHRVVSVLYPPTTHSVWRLRLALYTQASSKSLQEKIQDRLDVPGDCLFLVMRFTKRRYRVLFQDRLFSALVRIFLSLFRCTKPGIVGNIVNSVISVKKVKLLCFPFQARRQGRLRGPMPYKNQLGPAKVALLFPLSQAFFDPFFS